MTGVNAAILRAVLGPVEQREKTIRDDVANLSAKDRVLYVGLTLIGYTFEVGQNFWFATAPDGSTPQLPDMLPPLLSKAEQHRATGEWSKE